MFNLAGYLLWPFNKFVVKRRRFTFFYSFGPKTSLENQASLPQSVESNSAHNSTNISQSQHLNSNRNSSSSSSSTSKQYTKYCRNSRTPNMSTPYLSGRLIPIDDDEESYLASDDDNEDIVFRLDAPAQQGQDQSNEPEVNQTPRNTHKPPKPQSTLAENIFKIFLFLILGPPHLVVTLFCFLSVVAVPMAKLNFVLFRHLLRHGLKVSSQSERRAKLFKPVSISHQSQFHPPMSPITPLTPGGIYIDQKAEEPHDSEYKIIICTHNALGLQFYKVRNFSS
jgi:hypothetical protein